MIPKFRAWFITNKVMIPPMALTQAIHQKENQFSLARLEDEFIFMQSTGMFDKNGVEIYEGDIIGWRYVITYVDSSQPGNLGMSIGFYAQRDDFESYHMLDVGDEYEVLGNVYENPELLEVE